MWSSKQTVESGWTVLRTQQSKHYWAAEKWNASFIKEKEPSIDFLELFALTAGLLMWSDDMDIKDKHVTIFCDNMSVVNMVNNILSSCKNCMFLLRKIMKNSLLKNYGVFVHHVGTKQNDLADTLSRGQYDRFWRICREKSKVMSRYPCAMPTEIWSPENYWID